MIWQFHTMLPDHTHFLFLLDPPFYPWVEAWMETHVPSPQQEKKYTKANLCCPHTH